MPDTNPMVAASVAAVQQAGQDVVHTLRELALFELPSRPYLPEPHAVEAERSVLEALLWGRRRPADLACCASDFYLPAHAAIVAVVEAMAETENLNGRPNPKTIVGVLCRQGASAERAAQLLTDIIENEPMRADVDELAARVCELAQRRLAIKAMSKLDAAWRTGIHPGPVFFRRLRTLLEQWEGPTDA